MIIPGKYGHIFPHGDELLAVSIDGYPKIAAKVRRLSCCRVHQDGDRGELTAVFPAARFATVARIVKPRRRPVISPERRARMAERMQAIREMKAELQAKRDFTARGSDFGTPDDPEAA
ncbi:MAG: hypothetical protein GX621_03840 [Pirellulaceae bacterium]|nr:hypothetical protein [Pirellulaceae bacterium]